VADMSLILLYSFHTNLEVRYFKIYRMYFLFLSFFFWKVSNLSSNNGYSDNALRINVYPI